MANTLLSLVKGPKDGDVVKWYCYPLEWHIPEGGGRYERCSSFPTNAGVQRYEWVEDSSVPSLRRPPLTSEPRNGTVTPMTTDDIKIRTIHHGLVPCLPVHLTLRKIDALTPKEEDK